MKEECFSQLLGVAVVYFLRLILIIKIRYKMQGQGDILSGLEKLVLKCNVVLPQYKHKYPSSKVARKVNQLFIDKMHKNQHPQPPPLDNPEHISHQKKTVPLSAGAARSEQKGDAFLSSGQYVKALGCYLQEQQICAKEHSRGYYGILLKEVQCYKNLHDVKNTVRLYEQISLVYLGK